MKPRAKAPANRRPWRVAKKIRRRLGYLHHGPHVYVARVAESMSFMGSMIQDSAMSDLFESELLPELQSDA